MGLLIGGTAALNRWHSVRVFLHFSCRTSAGLLLFFGKQLFYFFNTRVLHGSDPFSVYHTIPVGSTQGDPARPRDISKPPDATRLGP